MVRRSITYRRHLRRIFLACLQTYSEIKADGYHRSCAAIYDALGRSGGARPGSNCAYVRATSSDFVADFELTAMRVLEPMQLAYFNMVFVHSRSEIDDAVQKAWPAKRYVRFCNQLAEKMGVALKQRGLFPLKGYFAPVFVGNGRSWPSGNCYDV